MSEESAILGGFKSAKLPWSIACFVYNRASKTDQMFRTLALNAESRYAKIFVFQDGAKNSIDQIAVDETSLVVAKWGKELNLHKITRPTNAGLKASIISGVTEVLHQSDAVIVIEDDLALSPFFLDFMLSGLSKYGENKDVVSIHGWKKPTSLPIWKSYFLRGADCWGWATWSDRWKLFLDELDSIGESFSEKERRLYNFGRGTQVSDLLEKALQGKVDSWALLWHTHAFNHNLLTLHPAEGLVRNEGLDGSGTHPGMNKPFSTRLSNSRVTMPSGHVRESKWARFVFHLTSWLESNKIRRLVTSGWTFSARVVGKTWRLIPMVGIFLSPRSIVGQRKTRRVGLVLSAPPEIGGGNVLESAILAAFQEDLPLGWELSVITKKLGSHLPLVPNSSFQRATEAFLIKLGAKIPFLIKKLGGPLQYLCLALRLDCIVFASPSLAMAQSFRVPVIGSVWDLGPFHFPELPEFSGQWGADMRSVVSGAAASNSRVMVPSFEVAEQLASEFGTEKSKIIVTGMRVPPRTEGFAPNKPLPKVYAVYPAKLWAHKNHETLFLAFSDPVLRDSNVMLVLTGIADGDRNKVDQRVRFHGLTNKVIVFGHLEREEAQFVIRNANCLVMPTLLGPTNYPPLEAASYGVHTIMSDAHKFDWLLPDWVSTLPALDFRRWAEEIAKKETAGREKPFVYPEQDMKLVIATLLNDVAPLEVS